MISIIIAFYESMQISSETAFIFVISTPDVHEDLVGLEDITFCDIETSHLVGREQLDHFSLKMDFFLFAAVPVHYF